MRNEWHVRVEVKNGDIHKVYTTPDQRDSSGAHISPDDMLDHHKQPQPRLTAKMTNLAFIGQLRPFLNYWRGDGHFR